jgi:hypothetical protein
VARGNGCGGLIAPPRRLRQDARVTRACFEGLPYGLLDREALRCGKPLGESLGFLRQINHAGQTSTSRRNYLENRGFSAADVMIGLDLHFWINRFKLVPSRPMLPLAG